MGPEAISLAVFIIQEAVKNEPAIADAIRSLFNKADPTPDDWAALRAKVQGKSYADYVPDSALAAAAPGAVTALAAPPASAPELTLLEAPTASQPAPLLPARPCQAQWIGPEQCLCPLCVTAREMAQSKA